MLTVIGHENPDTDNIAASIALAELLQIEGKEAKAFKKGNLNKETQWVLDYTGTKDKINELGDIPDGQEFFLVDFNEESQSPVDPSKIQLKGLLDHHKLAGSWKTEEPILYRIEPLGSSCTLVCKLVQEKKIELPAEISKLLLCGIISDTLKLTSPTTTEEDKAWVDVLVKQAQEDVNKLADSLFEAKSDLSEFTPEEIAKLDYKVFDLSGKKVGIGVIETVKPDNAKKIEKELKEVITQIKGKEGLDFIYLGIVDIIKNQTEVFLINPEAKGLIMKSFSDIVIADDNLILKGVVSRKKQIVPALEKTLKEIQ